MSPVTEGEIDQLVERIGADTRRIEQFLHVPVHGEAGGKLERSAAEVVAEAAPALCDAAERAGSVRTRPAARPVITEKRKSLAIGVSSKRKSPSRRKDVLNILPQGSL